MLRRLRIGSRFNLLITMQTLALLAFASIGYPALQFSDVTGTERMVIVVRGSAMGAPVLLNFVLVFRLRRAVARPARMLVAPTKSVDPADIPQGVGGATSPQSAPVTTP